MFTLSNSKIDFDLKIASVLILSAKSILLGANKIQVPMFLVILISISLAVNSP